MVRQKTKSFLVAVPRTAEPARDLLSARCNLICEIAEWGRRQRLDHRLDPVLLTQTLGEEVPSVEFAKTHRFFFFEVVYRERKAVFAVVV